MLRFASAAGVLAATLTCAGTAHAGQVLKVDDGQPRIVRDRLLRTALPPVPKRTRLLLRTVRSHPAPLQWSQRSDYDAALADARGTRDALPAGPARDELAGVIANAEALARYTQYLALRPG